MPKKAVPLARCLLHAQLPILTAGTVVEEPVKIKIEPQGEASPAAAAASSSSAARSAANAVPRDCTVTSPSVTDAISCTLWTCTAGVCEESRDTLGNTVFGPGLQGMHDGDSQGAAA